MSLTAALALVVQFALVDKQAFHLPRVLLPGLSPAIITGFALAFARAVGEYGSVIFIAGNLPFKTEISPLLIDFDIARTYEAMGKTKEAADLYFSVANQSPESALGTESTTRLTALDPARAEQVQVQAKKSPFAPSK